MRDGSFLQLLFSWGDIVERAHRAKQLPPEERNKVVRFGVGAVIGAFATALFSSALLLFKVGFEGHFIAGLFAVIGAVLLGCIVTLICLITTIIYLSCQFAINRSKGTWVTFAFTMLGLLLAVGIPLVFFAI